LDAPQSGALALPGDFTVIEASWSADGRWLAYSAMSPLGSAAANDAALYLVDTQDWTTRLLIEDVQPVLRLSPDARWVYAQRVRGTDKISLLISTDSTQAIESTPSYLWSGYSDSPRWSPDSRALVFTHQANNRLVVDVIGIDAQLKRRFENPMFIMGTLPVDEAWTHCEATPPTP
jgi:Tol biopolymer transport system component